MTPPFRLALVGCGGVAPMHFGAYAAHPDRVCVVAACDPVEARVKQAQGCYGFAGRYTSLDAMIAGTPFDIGVVCTPTGVRAEVVETLAAAGKHVFVEKPFADSLPEAQRMVAHCARAGVAVAVNQNFRYCYPFQIARRL